MKASYIELSSSVIGIFSYVRSLVTDYELIFFVTDFEVEKTRSFHEVRSFFVITLELSPQAAPHPFSIQSISVRLMFQYQL